jgi:hypothetical protein
MWSILIPLAILVIVILIQIRRVKEAFQDSTDTTPTLNTPKGITIDKSGNLYVADTGNNTIRKITAAGAVSTLAGNPDGSGFNNGTGSGALFKSPMGIVVDGEGNIIVADSGNHCIRKVTPAGVVTTIAGKGGTSGYIDSNTTSEILFNTPTGICINGNKIYVADSGNHCIRVIETQDSTENKNPYRCNTLAGTAKSSGDVDAPTIDSTVNANPALSAKFNEPFAITQDAQGLFYVSDKGNNKIKIIKSDSSGIRFSVTTLVSSGTSAITFNTPTGVYIDPASTNTSRKLFVCEAGANIVTLVTMTRASTDAATFTTATSVFAGQSGKSGTAITDTTTSKIDGDGKATEEAKLNTPYSIVKSNRVVNSSVELNTFFVADTGSHTIRKIYPTDTTNVSTSLVVLRIAGTGKSGFKDSPASTTTTTTTTTSTPSSSTSSSSSSSSSSSTGSTDTTSTDSSKITLTLADLMALYGFSTASKSSTSTTTSTDTGVSGSSDTTPTATATSTGISAQTAKDFYNEIKPSLLEDIRSTISKQFAGSPYASLGPMSSGYDDSSAACAQGNELNTAVRNVVDSNDYIRKDSIPCYGCSL